MASRLPESVPGTSVDRQCGSSQQRLHFAAQAVMSGTMDIVIAAASSDDAGTYGPYLLVPAKNASATTRARTSKKRYPHIQFSQFTGAEMMAEKYGLSKDDLDHYAYESHQRAIRGNPGGKFKTRSFRCRSPAPMARPTPMPSTRASASTSALTGSKASN